MGLLKAGKPLAWEDSAEHSRYIRRHGARQLVRALRRAGGLRGDPLYYGDEVEHSLLKLDRARREVRLSLRGTEVMELLRERELQAQGSDAAAATWHQEYGSWMLESTPAAPYRGSISGLLLVEQNMRQRRARLQGALGPDEIAPTMVNFPLMGVGEFTHPAAPPGGPASLSDSVPDACINAHPRFGTLTANIRSRRGSKVDIRVPLFQDSATPEFSAAAAAAAPGAAPPCIEMDCMAYGMGMCCLQLTFQAEGLDESRRLHDQLAVLAPLLLALTAATPIFRGRLAGTDVRWSALSQAVDDRTPAERGEATGAGAADARLAGAGVKRLSKSRFDSISGYIHPASSRFDDVACEVDEELEAELLREEGVDAALARHVAHLFVRDPLVAFEGAVEEVDDERSNEHFESLNSTNWQTVRFKPPPVPEQCAPHIGWRTEFRPMEVQPTDFENAAFVVFMVLLSRALLAFDLDVLVPLSKVDENMRRAHSVGAVTAEKFWFRTDLCHEAEAREMSMDEIMNGREGGFPGLVPICYAYLEHIHCEAATLARLRRYLGLVQGRAAGRLLTPAAWMRRFVREHAEYKHDSVVTQGIAHDLVSACHEVGLGWRPCPELHGAEAIEPIAEDSGKPLVSARATATARSALLRQCRAAGAAAPPLPPLPPQPSFDGLGGFGGFGGGFCKGGLACTAQTCVLVS